MIKEKLGEIFWWICQAKPWAFGDPSIAELFIRSLWLAMTGKLMPAWKEGLIPWSETVSNFNVTPFKKEFPKLLDNAFGYPPPQD